MNIRQVNCEEDTQEEPPHAQIERQNTENQNATPQHHY